MVISRASLFWIDFSKSFSKSFLIFCFSLLYDIVYSLILMFVISHSICFDCEGRFCLPYKLFDMFDIVLIFC